MATSELNVNIKADKSLEKATKSDKKTDKKKDLRALAIEKEAQKKLNESDIKQKEQIAKKHIGLIQEKSNLTEKISDDEKGKALEKLKVEREALNLGMKKGSVAMNQYTDADKIAREMTKNDIKDANLKYSHQRALLQSREKSLKRQNRVEQRFARLGVDITKNQQLQNSFLSLSAKKQEEILHNVEREGYAQRIRTRERTRMGMYFLSMLYVGDKVRKLFLGITQGAMNSFKEITKGSKGASVGISMLDANIKYVQFSLGAALSDALLPYMDTIASIAEWLSDLFTMNPTWTLATLFGGIALGTLASIVGAFVLLSISMTNMADAKAAATTISAIFQAIKKAGIVEVGIAPVATGTGVAAGKTLGNNVGTGMAVGIVPWYSKVWTGIKTFLGKVGTGIAWLFGGTVASITALVLLILGIGLATETWNDKIEETTANWGEAGHSINIVADAFAILWNVVWGGLKYAIKGITILVSYIVHDLIKCIIDTTNAVIQLINLIPGINFDFITFEGIANGMEKARQATSEWAKEVDVFKGGWNIGAEISHIADATTAMGYERYQAEETRRAYAKTAEAKEEFFKMRLQDPKFLAWQEQERSPEGMERNKRELQQLLQLDTTSVDTQLTEFFNTTQQKLSENELDLQLTFDNNLETLDTGISKFIDSIKIDTINQAQQEGLGMDLINNVITGWNTGANDFKNEVADLTENVLEAKFNESIVVINKNLGDQQQELVGTTKLMSEFAIATNSAAAAQERLNKAKNNIKGGGLNTNFMQSLF